MNTDFTILVLLFIIAFIAEITDLFITKRNYADEILKNLKNNFGGYTLISIILFILFYIYYVVFFKQGV